MDLEQIRSFDYLRPELRIAFVGHSKLLPREGFKRFIEENIEQVKSIDKYRLKATFKNGSIVEAVPFDWRLLDGKRYDQLIICGASRWDKGDDKYEDNLWALKALIISSCVPKEFQILNYVV